MFLTFGISLNISMGLYHPVHHEASLCCVGESSHELIASNNAI
ncbi:hypothetical protein CI610_01394 [invertebrate metagenome]|uniref:Uncharacterized protein n=1 Tax=invertebrate metagenome TaxID=1711999 RepID=A0A2H9T8V6_9ZZZZ